MDGATAGYLGPYRRQRDLAALSHTGFDDDTAGAAIDGEDMPGLDRRHPSAGAG